MPLYQFLWAVVMAVPGTQAVEPLAFLLLLLSELLVVLGYLAGTVSSGVGYDRYHHDEQNDGPDDCAGSYQDFLEQAGTTLKQG